MMQLRSTDINQGRLGILFAWQPLGTSHLLLSVMLLVLST